MRDVAERFWQKVEKNEGCWIWRGALSRDGYGQFSLHGRTVSAHRVSYELEYGEIPDGMLIDHTCRTRSCVRPDHLEAVTLRENTMRGLSAWPHE